MAIKQEVLTGHLQSRPRELAVLQAVAHAFDINHGRESRAANALLSVYHAMPRADVKEAFGFDQELLIVYSKFDKLQPRVLQAVDDIQNDESWPRADRRVFILISEAPNPLDWVSRYRSDNRNQRLIVTFSAADLVANAKDTWYVRNVLMSQLYSRDLFGEVLALDSDNGFFGRSVDLQALQDVIRNGGIGGLFGLRKTGKTSLLNKLGRLIGAEAGYRSHRLNCESAVIRSLNAIEFLDHMSDLLVGKTVRSRKLSNAALRLANAAASATRNDNRAIFLLDEFEKVSPFAVQNKHWQNDFVDVWQVLRDVLDGNRRLSFVLAGVNPAVTEVPEFADVANPLFGIVSVRYLTGLKLEEVREMLRTLGHPTGVQFDETAVRYVHLRYGGNTYLTRLACKYLCEAHPTGRPLTVGTALLVREEASREGTLAPYCVQVLNDLKKFYPDEYKLLEMLACGQLVDFHAKSKAGLAVPHLKGYGLLEDTPGGPAIGIAVVGRYLAEANSDKWLPPVGDRPVWLRDRVNSLTDSIRHLERKLLNAGAPVLFGDPSFPHADDFKSLNVATDRDSFQTFINTMNRCFVESIELLHKRSPTSRSFWSTRNDFPDLFPVLDRIKVYRHNEMHLTLDAAAEEKFSSYRTADLHGLIPSLCPDLHFTLQFRLLELMLVKVYTETDRLE